MSMTTRRSPAGFGPPPPRAGAGRPPLAPTPRNLSLEMDGSGLSVPLEETPVPETGVDDGFYFFFGNNFARKVGK